MSERDPPPRLIPRTALARSRELRREPTEFEDKLWQELRNRSLGYKFRRQLWIGDYFADLCCLQRRLIVEVDGEQHADERRKYDEQRTADLAKRGFRVIRFWNDEIVEDLDSVLERIWEALKKGRS